MMRIAIFSDNHANSIAFDAVPADIAALRGVDAYWALGDFVAFGPDPVGVLARLAQLDPLIAILGNTDVYVRSGMRPRPFVGHTRWPTNLRLGTTHAVNAGSVGPSHRVGIACDVRAAP